MARTIPSGFKDKAKGGKGKSLSKSAVNRIMQSSSNQIPGASFSDLAKLDKQTQVKYDRPADLSRYVNKLDLYNQGIKAGATVDPVTGRMNLVNKGITDDQGRTILSMDKPYITAQAPTMGQLFGDVKRAFTGYNQLSYDPNAVGPKFTTGGTYVREPGLIQRGILTPGLTIAQKLMEGVQNLKDYGIKTLDKLKQNVISNKSDVKQEIINRGKDKSPYTWNQVNQEIEEEAQSQFKDMTPFNLNVTDFEGNTYQPGPVDNSPIQIPSSQPTQVLNLEEKYNDMIQRRNGGIVSLLR